MFRLFAEWFFVLLIVVGFTIVVYGICNNRPWFARIVNKLRYKPEPTNPKSNSGTNETANRE